MRLFISYARQDTPTVQTLIEVLRVGGHDAWIDQQLTLGRDWQAQIKEAIARCDAFVYALSPASVASEWCLWEMIHAVRLGKPIAPVLLLPVERLPAYLSDLQYADLTLADSDQAAARLLDQLGDLGALLSVDSVPALPDPGGVPERLPESLDPLYPQAVTVAVQHDGVSISLLQRALKVGYARAKRMTDLMEEEGIIGPYPGGGRLRALLGMPPAENDESPNN